MRTLLKAAAPLWVFLGNMPRTTRLTYKSGLREKCGLNSGFAMLRISKRSLALSIIETGFPVITIFSALYTLTSSPFKACLATKVAKRPKIQLSPSTIFIFQTNYSLYNYDFRTRFLVCQLVKR